LASCTRVFVGEGGGNFNLLGIDLRYIHLQEEANNADDAKHTISDLMLCAYHAIAFSVSSFSRRQAFDFLSTLYCVPEGAREVARLGQPIGLLHNVAEKML
jgi:hypothetical protein